MDWTGILQTAGQQGLLFGLVALSVALSFRVLSFPDLTVDGSLALGGAIVATLVTAHHSPVVATVLAAALGGAAGAATGFLSSKMRVSPILSGILVMTMLYTVNLRIMGRPNVSLLEQGTILSPFERLSLPHHAALIGFFLVVAVLAKMGLDLVFRTNLGLMLLATGDNPRSVLAAGSDPGNMRIIGLAMANSLTALAGAMLAQSFGFADIGMGVGVIVIGFASLLIGETVIPPRTVFRLTLAALAGSVIYQTIAATALRIGLAPPDLKLATSAMVIMVLSIQSLRRRPASAEAT